MSKKRVIAHVDMDAFFASVEQRDQPELRGKPVVVGGSGGRGVVAAASYEIREFGVRSAMPGREALRRCPEAVFVKPRIGHYRDVSAQIFAVFREFTELVEGLSLDEAFLDLSALDSTPGELGRAIKQRIHEETGLTASVGIGPNKLVAKIASDLDKPDGLCIVSRHHVKEILGPLPVRRLSGIGPKTAQRLAGLGVTSIAQLGRAHPDQLRSVFGRYTHRVLERARGIDDRPVVAHSERKSISAEETFASNIANREKLLAEVSSLAEKVGTALRSKELVAGVVSVKIRTGDFVTRTRQRRLSPPGNDSGLIIRSARTLVAEWLQSHPGRALRLVGVGVSELQPALQYGLFEEKPESTALDHALDQIRDRFGGDSIGRGKPGR